MSGASGAPEAFAVSRASLSVVIPCYNAEAYLAEAIDSVLMQREVAAELIVVDDGSTDESAAVASAYPEVRHIRTANRGVSAARNRGIAEARGALLKFLDADDKLLPGALACQLKRAQALAPHELPFGDYRLCGQDHERRKRGSRLSSRHHLASVILANIHPSTPLHRRELLERVGGFDERFASDEDWNLHVRLAAAGARFRLFPDVISQYRVHEAEHRLSNAKLRVSDYVAGELERLH